MNPWLLGSTCLVAGFILGALAMGIAAAARESVPSRYLLGRCGSCRHPVWGSDEYRVIHRSCPKGGSGRSSVQSLEYA